MAEISAITPFTLTSKGLKLQAKVQAGLCKLNFVKAVIGYGYLTEEASISSMTQLIHEIPSRQTGESGDEPTVDMTLMYADEQTAQTAIRIHIQNGNNPHTYAREIGFIADDPAEGHILYGVANLGDEAPSLPAYNGAAHVSCNIDIPIAITNAKDVTVNFTLTAGVQHEEFEAHTNNTGNPHNVTAEQLGLGDVLEDIEKMPYRLLKYFGTQRTNITITAKRESDGSDAWYTIYDLYRDTVRFSHGLQLPVIWADIDLIDGSVILDDWEFHFYMQFFDDRVEIHRWRMGDEEPPAGAWRCEMPERGAESTHPEYPSGTYIYKLQFN